MINNQDNQPCKVRPITIAINSSELRQYLFVVSLDKFSASSDNFDNLCDTVFVSNKTKNMT